MWDLVPQSGDNVTADIEYLFLTTNVWSTEYKYSRTQIILIH